ncbi:flagellar hook-basal body complex protein FliE [Chitinimonas sp.]|uniref:flagellar hook-basal body complex protein FliE n=1 Tax=Chitinimonas sp. TaxID=1934313 RepID=UPI0035AE83D1
MSIAPIAFLPAQSLPSLDNPPAPSAPTGDFAGWFAQELSQVNQQLLTADHGVQQLAAGQASNLHQVMINLEEAKVSLQMVMQVRNHLLDAYRELLQMQM